MMDGGGIHTISFACRFQITACRLSKFHCTKSSHALLFVFVVKKQCEQILKTMWIKLYGARQCSYGSGHSWQQALHFLLGADTLLTTESSPSGLRHFILCSKFLVAFQMRSQVIGSAGSPSMLGWPSLSSSSLSFGSVQAAIRRWACISAIV